MGRPKGLPKTGGRKPGVTNKVTASVKAAMTEAFEGLGGTPSLIAWGQENKNLFYPLWVRIAPQEHDLTSNGHTLEALVSASRRDPLE